MTRHLLECWPQIRNRLKESESVALFLDFDGTLARLHSRPEEVWLHPATRRVLLRLAHRPQLRVWVISGRRLADVRKRTRVPGLRYLGLHGWEGGDSEALSEAAQAGIAEAANVLSQRLARVSGVWIENKGATFALHYRGARASSLVDARAQLVGVLAPFKEKFRVIEGDQVWEVLPVEVEGKGAAARDHWRSLKRHALPIYVGNDGTDESAFITLAHGVTVRVGPRRRSRARFRLRGPNEVRQFLEKLEEELR